MQALIVDDSGHMRRFLRSVLRGAGFGVLEADCGADALELLRRRTADVGIFECRMEEMSGVELLQKVRADATCRQMKILMVSPECNRRDLQCGLCSGADGCLLKPFTRDSILHALEIVGAIEPNRDPRPHVSAPARVPGRRQRAVCASANAARACCPATRKAKTAKV